MSVTEIKARTAEAIADPQAGDCYQEMYSYWLFVVYSAGNGGPVVTMGAGAPCSFPDSEHIEVRAFSTVAEFATGQVRYSFLNERGIDVDGWLDKRYPEPRP